MGYSKQSNVSFGDPWTASLHNTLLANIDAVWSGATDNHMLIYDTTDTIVAVPYLPGCQVWSSSSGATDNDVPTSTDLPSTDTTFTVSFVYEANPIYDDANFFSTDNPTYVTIPYNGYYLIGVAGTWEATWAGQAEVGITVNGVGGQPIQIIDASLGGSGGVPRQVVVYERKLTAGDQIGLEVWQNSGDFKTFDFGVLWLRMTRRTT